jgi:hypothetical protein
VAGVDLDGKVHGAGHAHEFVEEKVVQRLHAVEVAGQQHPPGRDVVKHEGEHPPQTRQHGSPHRRVQLEEDLGVGGGPQAGAGVW